MQNSPAVRERLPEEDFPEVQITVTDRTLQEVIRMAAITKDKIRSFEGILKILEDRIVEETFEYLKDDGEVVFTTMDRIRAVVRVEYSWGEIPDENVSALHELLGERYHDLVERQVIVRPTPKLIAMACDGDRGREIRKHLSIHRKAPVVRIVAEEPGKKGAGQ